MKKTLLYLLAILVILVGMLYFPLPAGSITNLINDYLAKSDLKDDVKINSIKTYYRAIDYIQGKPLQLQFELEAYGYLVKADGSLSQNPNGEFVFTPVIDVVGAGVSVSGPLAIYADLDREKMDLKNLVVSSNKLDGNVFEQDLTLSISTSANEKFESISGEIKIEPTELYGIEVGEAQLKFNVEEFSKVQYVFEVSEITFEKGEELAVNAQKSQVRGRAIKNNGWAIQSVVQTGPLEALLGELYLDLDLSEYKIAMRTQLNELNKPEETIVKIVNPWMDVSVETNSPMSTNFLMSTEIEISNLTSAKELISQLELVENIDDMDIQGSLYFQTEGHVSRSKNSFKIKKALFELANLNWTSQSLGAQIKQANISIPVKRGKTTKGKISFNEGSFKQSKLKFSNLPLNIKYLTSPEDYIEITSENSLSVNTRMGKFALGELFAETDTQFIAGEKFKWKLDGQLDLGRLEFTEVLNTFCMSPKVMPPAHVPATKVFFTSNPKQLVTDGNIQLNTLGGSIRVENFKVFNFLSPFPETQIDVDIDKLKLRSFGKWAKFGKMEGLINGHFKNAVWQGKLLTQFYSKLSLDGRRGQKAYFSGKAMKNFLSIVGLKDTLKQLEVIDPIYFGWVSDLIGGFPVEYGGISLYSKGGSILLETLDPPSELKGNNPTHYLLKSQRMSIPISSRSYPVILDAHSIFQYINYMESVIQGLQQQGSSGYNGSSNNTVDEVKDDQCRLF